MSTDHLDVHLSTFFPSLTNRLGHIPLPTSAYLTRFQATALSIQSGRPWVPLIALAAGIILYRHDCRAASEKGRGVSRHL